MSECQCKACQVLEQARLGEVPLRLCTDSTGYFSAEIGYRGKPDAMTDKHRSLDEVLDWVIQHEIKHAPNGSFARWASGAGDYLCKPLVGVGAEFGVRGESLGGND